MRESVTHLRVTSFKSFAEQSENRENRLKKEVETLKKQLQKFQPIVDQPACENWDIMSDIPEVHDAKETSYEEENTTITPIVLNDVHRAKEKRKEIENIEQQLNAITKKKKKGYINFKKKITNIVNNVSSHLFSFLYIYNV